MTGAGPLRILVVDDDEVDRLAIHRALRASGLDVSVEEASDATEALSAVASRVFDCVLLDYYLPGSDGLDVLRGLRTRGSYAAVVMLTGRGDEHTAVELMKAGAADYLAKSGLSGERLAQSLRYAMERQRLEVERNELLAREQEARREAERANVAKDRFLAVLSHELRTPLNAVLGWTRILRTEKFDEDRVARSLEIVERNARVLMQLIEDLLDVSRIVSGKLHLDLRSVEPVTVCANAIEAVRLAAEAKGVRIEERLDPKAGPISGDPDRLQQIVWNLLTNAIKFTPPTGTIRLELRPLDSGVEIDVADSGQGIPAEFLARVFEPFSQVDARDKRGPSGLGLGLTIVQNLVELHGGTVRAESEGEGRGARFVVRLPFVPAGQTEKPGDKRPTAAPPPRPGRPTLEGIAVLFVDDNADARELVRTILAAQGAAVRACASIDEALAALERERPDVVVSDIEMPDGDGYELIRALRLREDPESRIPAIALTGFVRAEDRIRVLAAGYQLHVPKPLDPAELVTAVASVLARQVNTS